jgi:hypothetical protein
MVGDQSGDLLSARSKHDHLSGQRQVGPRCVTHLGAPCLRLGGELSSAPMKLSGLHQLRLFAPEFQHGFELSAVRISRLPGNDRPLTHTVTLHLARSLILARWRHENSLPRLAQRIRYPRLLLAALITLSGAILPRAEAIRFLTLRQVQHLKYRAQTGSAPGRRWRCTST